MKQLRSTLAINKKVRKAIMYKNDRVIGMYLSRQRWVRLWLRLSEYKAISKNMIRLLLRWKLEPYLIANMEEFIYMDNHIKHYLQGYLKKNSPEAIVKRLARTEKMNIFEMKSKYLVHPKSKKYARRRKNRN